MRAECTKEAATVEEAVDSALEELGVQQDAVEYEVLQEPSRGFLGMGADRPAKVRVWVVESALATEEIPLEEESVDEEGLPAELLAEATEPEELSDEELDRVADTALGATREILSFFGVQEPTIEEYEGDEGEIILDVMAGDLGLLIGRHGRTLDALQVAAAAITTKRLGFRYPVMVDIEGYRHRRRQKIEDIARRAADRALRQRTAVRLRPMTAYERRIVHVALRNNNRIETVSEGADPYRQVVVKPR